MAELVDALDSGSSSRKAVEVRVLSRAPCQLKGIQSCRLTGLYPFVIMIFRHKFAPIGKGGPSVHARVRSDQ